MAEVALSECVSSQILDTITRLESQLDQLRHEQLVLGQSIADASDRNAKDDEELRHMKETIAKVSEYYTKLLSLRSTMTMLSTRSGQLHRRADKLKQIKLQYLSQIDTIRRTEQARDQAIAARVISPSTSKAALLPPRSPVKTSSTPTQTCSSPSPVVDVDTAYTFPEAASTATATATATAAAAAVVAVKPSTSDTPVIAVAKKVKKKKPKAREVAISDEAWTPKRSSSSRSFDSSRN